MILWNLRILSHIHNFHVNVHVTESQIQGVRILSRVAGLSQSIKSNGMSSQNPSSCYSLGSYGFLVGGFPSCRLYNSFSSCACAVRYFLIQLQDVNLSYMLLIGSVPLEEISWFLWFLLRVKLLVLTLRWVIDKLDWHAYLISACHSSILRNWEVVCSQM